MKSVHTEPSFGPRSSHVDGVEDTSVTFLVNEQTPFDNSSYTCATTDPLSPETPLNKSEKIMMGNCDNGSLIFTIHSDEKGNTSVAVSYTSTFIATAYTWTCTIDWNYAYHVPSQTMRSACFLVASLQAPLVQSSTGMLIYRICSIRRRGY